MRHVPLRQVHGLERHGTRDAGPGPFSARTCNTGVALVLPVKLSRTRPHTDVLERLMRAAERGQKRLTCPTHPERPKTRTTRPTHQTCQSVVLAEGVSEPAELHVAAGCAMRVAGMAPGFNSHVYDRDFGLAQAAVRCGGAAVRAASRSRRLDWRAPVCAGRAAACRRTRALVADAAHVLEPRQPQPARLSCCRSCTPAVRTSLLLSTMHAGCALRVGVSLSRPSFTLNDPTTSAIRWLQTPRQINSSFASLETESDPCVACVAQSGSPTPQPRLQARLQARARAGRAWHRE